MGMEAVCPVCDSTDYVLRQGQYFCRMCNTQSQELGMETVMDDETIPMEVQGRNNAITIGRKRKGRVRKRSLCEGVRWGTAEGFSWVLRGWVDQLRNMGVDVEIAVIQLWTVYLRALKMGFEKKGEVGMIGRENMRYREKWNMIGGPPGVLHCSTLAAAKRRRVAAEEEDGVGEEEEYGEETLQERRIRSKKRKHFFKSVSTADSGSEMDPKSPSAGSVGDGVSVSTSGQVESEDDYSESGHITDPGLLSVIMERFFIPLKMRAQQNAKKRGELAYPNGDSFAKTYPFVLSMRQMAALLTLATIARPESSLTISDMVRLFNSEALAWKSALTFLPPAYSPTSHEAVDFSGREIIFTTNTLSLMVSRLASFLYQQTPAPYVPKHINLVFSLPSLKRTENNRSSQTFNLALARLLHDLSLPSVLCKDIIRIFKRLHLLNISATLKPYPSGAGMHSDKFPLVSKRILALILFTLKYHCGLDDQYEVYMSHNIKKMAKLDSGSDINYFDILTWIRLSKLRLDLLMSTSHCVREQYHSLAHVGTPDLVLPAILSKLRVEDKIHHGPGGVQHNPDKRFSQLSKLMSELSVKAKPIEMNQLSLEPLLDQSEALLGSGATKPGTKTLVRKLLGMTEANMKLCYEMDTCSLRNILQTNHGVPIFSEFRKKTEKKVKLEKNWIVTPDFYGHGNGSQITTEQCFQKQSKDQFIEMVTSGKTRKSRFSVPQPKTRPDNFFRVTNKVYWFAHHYTWNQMTNGRKIDKELLTDQVLDIMPSNFSWILKYFSCYAHLPPLELLEELNEIEKLVLRLDPEYFGLPKKLGYKNTYNHLRWKGGKVTVGGRKIKKGQVAEVAEVAEVAGLDGENM